MWIVTREAGGAGIWRRMMSQGRGRVPARRDTADSSCRPGPQGDPGHGHDAGGRGHGTLELRQGRRAVTDGSKYTGCPTATRPRRATAP